MVVPFIQPFESKGLNMLMKAMAKIDTKRTMIIWFLFSSMNFGTFLNSDERYSFINLKLAAQRLKFVVFHAKITIFFVLHAEPKLAYWRRQGNTKKCTARRLCGISSLRLGCIPATAGMPEAQSCNPLLQECMVAQYCRRFRLY